DSFVSPIITQPQSLETLEAHFPTQVSDIDGHKGQKRRKTTEAEKRILAPLLEMEKSLPISMLMRAFDELNAVSSDWSVDRIRLYWRNNRNKKTS
ncbi:9768_t:CDS:1, partial [Scutellospora calospora]